MCLVFPTKDYFKCIQYKYIFGVLQMKTCSLCQYRNKQHISIHLSWLNAPIMNIFRVIALGLIILRFALYIEDPHNQNSFIYLTFYDFVISWIYFACVNLDFLVNKLIWKKNNFLQLSGDCVNILYQSAFALELVLTILYWTVLYSSDAQDAWGFDNLGVHAMPLMLLCVDFVLNSYQFPYRHIIVTFVLAAIYMIINQVHACTDEPVYPVYECGNIWLPIAAFVGLAGAHLIGHFIWKYWRRSQIKGMMKKQDQEESLLQ